MTLTPVLGFVCSVRGRTVLLECERVIFEMFLHFNMGWSQNIFNIRVCVQFGTLFNKDKSGSPILRDGSPYHCQGRFLAAVNGIYGTGNVVSTLSQNSVVLRVELGLNSKIFSSEKKIFPASVPSFIRFRRILALYILFCFCNAVSWCLLVIFKGDNLRSSLTIVLTVFFINF